jgi:CobQ-like glutamine amidotransferase family enzyme
MSLYGDRGNVLVLNGKSQEAGFEFEIQDCTSGEAINPKTNIILLGGGQDQDQELIVRDLLNRREEIKSLVEGGAIFLGVCGGYQLIGESYEYAVGNYLEGLKLLNLKTIREKKLNKRIIGNLKAHSELLGNLTGFENHGGRTILGEGLTPLAKVIEGGGNNGEDGTEGVIANLGKGLIIGTYFHTFLPKNPKVAEYMINFISKTKNTFTPDLLEINNHKKNMSLRY